MEPRLKKKKSCSGMNFSEFHFGSPSCSLEELTEFFNHLKALSVRNKRDLLLEDKILKNEINIQCGLYAWGPSAEFIMQLCEYWKLREETKYAALEIFSLFMTRLVAQLHDMIYSKCETEDETTSESSTASKFNGSSENTRMGSAINSRDRTYHMNWSTGENGRAKSELADKEWKNTLEHITDQMKLRAVTAIIIASKVTDHENIITLNKALDFLIKQGHHYSKCVLLKSELRILSTINYDVRRFCSPYPSVMLLLELLCRSMPKLNGGEIYQSCVRLLDLFYYFRPYVMGNLCNMHVSDIGLPEIVNEKQAVELLDSCCDLVTISGALVSVAVYIKDKNLSDGVIHYFGELIGIDSEKTLTRACCVMLKTLLNTEC